MANEGEKLEQGTTTWRRWQGVSGTRLFRDDGMGYESVINEDNLTVAECALPEYADQIIADHNAAHLLETAKDALSRTCSMLSLIRHRADRRAWADEHALFYLPDDEIDAVLNAARDALKSLEAGK